MTKSNFAITGRALGDDEASTFIYNGATYNEACMAFEADILNDNDDPEREFFVDAVIESDTPMRNYGETAKQDAPVARDPVREQMEAFIRSMAAMTTPADEIAELVERDGPDVLPRHSWATETPDDDAYFYEMDSVERQAGEYAAFMAMVRDARKILNGEATADSRHVAPVSPAPDAPDGWHVDQTNGHFCRREDDGDDDRVMEAPAEAGEVYTLNGRTFAATIAGCQHMDTRTWFNNRYRCDDCGTEWSDEWSCACDDECPDCGMPHSPYDTDDLTKTPEWVEGMAD